MTGFADTFYNVLGEEAEKFKTRKYLDSSGKLHFMPDICDEFVGPDHNVAILAIRYSVLDMFYIREKTSGKIYCIDADPEYPYNLIKRAVINSDENALSAFLPGSKEYCSTEKGLEDINQLFAEINVKLYVDKFPPLPEEIPDSSLDSVFIMSLLATPIIDKENMREFYPNLIDSIGKKLKPSGRLIVEESFGSDLLYDFIDWVSAQSVFNLKNAQFRELNNNFFMTPNSRWIIFPKD